MTPLSSGTLISVVEVIDGKIEKKRKGRKREYLKLVMLVIASNKQNSALMTVSTWRGSEKRG